MAGPPLLWSGGVQAHPWAYPWHFLDPGPPPLSGLDIISKIYPWSYLILRPYHKRLKNHETLANSQVLKKKRRFNQYDAKIQFWRLRFNNTFRKSYSHSIFVINNKKVSFHRYEFFVQKCRIFPYAKFGPHFGDQLIFVKFRLVYKQTQKKFSLAQNLKFSCDFEYILRIFTFLYGNFKYLVILLIHVL